MMRLINGLNKMEKQFYFKMMGKNDKNLCFGDGIKTT